MGVSLSSRALESLRTLPQETQSAILETASWLAAEQRPGFLDYRVAPYTMKPLAGYVFLSERYWIIYTLDQSKLQVFNAGDANTKPSL